jgi:uroporphyrinogen decarboxylase
MNDRQRFTATMHYQPRDRAPLYDFNFWDETIPEWHKQGLPEWVTRANAAEFFGLDASLGGGDAHWNTGCNVGLCPAFETKVLEDRGDYEVVQQPDGVRVLRKKYMSSIPQHEGHLLVDRKSWLMHYKPRLDPSHPGRFPQKGDKTFGAGSSGTVAPSATSPTTWEERVAHWRDPKRDHPIILPGGSLYGWIRNWMGVENLSLVVYDEPAFFEEMVETVTDCIVSVLDHILATGAQFEMCGMWEDMCYNAGPLLGPEQFKQFLVPRYKRITSLLCKHGVDVCWIDCDGNIEKLVPLWLDAGVNCMFPVEVGTWGGDPVAYRKQYGKDLLIMGGVDKHILARTKADIQKEVERLAPLVEEGGFIPMPDHRVPPDVPLENYIFYCEQARKVWGGGANLKPIRR